MIKPQPRLLLTLICICANLISAEAQNVNTVARFGRTLQNKNWYYKEPIGPNLIHDVAVDNSGNLYLTDADSNMIRKLDVHTGEYTIYAGTGVAGATGDGGLAINAQLYAPAGIKVDKDNNVIFADERNNRIRKINTTTGIISTICGTGIGGYSGDGGLATAARISRPQALAFDKTGNIYFSDRENHRIRKIDIATGNISTYAGSGVIGYGGDFGPANMAAISFPRGLAFDTSDNLYIADYGNERIRVVDALSKSIVTFAGAAPGTGSYSDSLPATSAALGGPTHLSFDQNQNLYVSEQNQSVIRKINTSTGYITREAGFFGVFEFLGDGGPAKTCVMNRPQGIACDTKNNLTYFIDAYNYRVRVIDHNNTPGSPSGVDSIISYCQGEEPGPLPISGANIKWYNTAVGGTALSSPPAINTSKADTFVYFFTFSASGKESLRKALVVGIKNLPPTPTVLTPVHYCYGDSTTFLIAEIEFGNQLKWYSDSDRVTKLGDFPKPSSFIKGLSKYYVAAKSQNGCEGELAVVDVYIHRPEPPTVNSPNILCTGSGVDTLKAEGDMLTWFESNDESDTGLVNTPTIRTSDTGTYTFYVSQTDTMGCESERATLTTMVKARPKAPEVSSPLSYCQEDEAGQLEASGSRLKWYNSQKELIDTLAPSPSTAAAGSVIYYVSQSSEFGCESELKTLEVAVHPKPSVKVEEKAYAPTTALKVELTASGANTYRWDNNSNNASFSYTPENAGIYKHWVIGYSENGCASDTVFHSKEIVSDFYWNGEITVFPNPCTDYITVTGIDLKDVISINVHNMQGRLVAQSPIPASVLWIQLPSDLPTGCYIVEINTVGNANPSKIIYKQ